MSQKAARATAAELFPAFGLAGVWERNHWTVVLVTHDISEAVFLSDGVYALTARPCRGPSPFSPIRGVG